MQTQNPIHMSNVVSAGVDVETGAHVTVESAVAQDNPSHITIGDILKRKDLLNLAMISIQLISIFDEQTLSTKFWQAAAGLLVAKFAYLRAHATLMTSENAVVNEEYVAAHEKDKTTLFLEGFSAAKNYVDVYTSAYCWLAALNLALTAYVSNEEFFFLSSRSTANAVLSMIEVDTSALIQVISNILYFNVALLFLVLSPVFLKDPAKENLNLNLSQMLFCKNFWLKELFVPLVQGGLMLTAYGAIHEPIMAGKRPGVFTQDKNDELIAKFNEIVEQTAWTVTLSITNFKPGIDFAHPIEATQSDLKPTNVPSGHTMLVFMATFVFIVLAFTYLKPEFSSQSLDLCLFKTQGLNLVLFMAILPGLFEGFCRSFGLSHSFSGVLEALCYGYLALVIGYIEKQSLLNTKQWIGEFISNAKNFIVEAWQHSALSSANAAGMVAGLIAEPLAMPARAAYQQRINLLPYLQGEGNKNGNEFKASLNL